MRRRQFLQMTAAAAATGMFSGAFARDFTKPIPMAVPSTPASFGAARRFASLPVGRIAYIERGRGPAALFLHGAPLNGLQWRGALDRLAAHRRCIVPDFMGLGYSEVPAGRSLAAADQAGMLAQLLDALREPRVDIVASDIGTAVAQLFLRRFPDRVRSLLLTNGDVEPDSPAAKVKPAIAMARAGTLADATAAWLTDKTLARSTFGAAVYHDPSVLTDEVIQYYVSPLVASPLRRQQYHAFHLAMEPNPLAGIEAALRKSTVPVRIVWGASDDIFLPKDAHYLDQVFPGSRGIAFVPKGKLFFPEEYPDMIATEARHLWGIA
jgi:pimeloyl-ACP methyl ester carboxylesterase